MLVAASTPPFPHVRSAIRQSHAAILGLLLPSKWKLLTIFGLANGRLQWPSHTRSFDLQCWIYPSYFSDLASRLSADRREAD